MPSADGGGWPAAFRYLNSEFYDRFSVGDKALIAETQVINNDNQWYGTSGGNDTYDKIFLLSLEDVVRYFGDSGQLKNRPGEDTKSIDDQYNSNRIARDANSDLWGLWWWLRSPGYYSGGAAGVNGGGGVGGSDVIDYYGGVRPALWLTL